MASSAKQGDVANSDTFFESFFRDCHECAIALPVFMDSCGAGEFLNIIPIHHSVFDGKKH